MTVIAASRKLIDSTELQYIIDCVYGAINAN
jgi:hypothetical protein